LDEEGAEYDGENGEEEGPFGGDLGEGEVAEAGAYYADGKRFAPAEFIADVTAAGACAQK
jgi:hypothetical protein